MHTTKSLVTAVVISCAAAFLRSYDLSPRFFRLWDDTSGTPSIVSITVN